MTDKGAYTATAIGDAADPIATYNKTLSAYNDGDEVSERAYLEAFDRMNDFQPKTERDFARKFIAMWKEGGNPDKECINALLTCGIGLVGEA